MVRVIGRSAGRLLQPRSWPLSSRMTSILRRRVVVGLLLLAVGAATLWWVVTGRAGRPAPGPSSGTPVPGGVLVATYRTEPRSFNRYVARDAASELISRLLNDSLVRIDRVTGEVEPRLAERWAVSDDGRTFTLALRQGVEFSDGTPFTSADVVFSFDAAYHGDGTQVAEDFKVDGQPLVVSAPDAHTVVVRFPSVYAPGLRMLDALPILPRHKLEAAFSAGRFRQAWTTSTPAAEIVGLGPFTLGEYVPGQRLVLARNPRFWRTDASGRRLPYLDRLVIEIVPDQNVEVLRLLAGQADLTTSEARPEDIGAFRRAARDGRLQLVEVGVGLNLNQLWFNLRPEAKAADPRRAWLQSEGLRLAIAHAVDRDVFVNTVYLGAAVPVHGPVSPGNRGWYSPEAPTYPYDLDRARALLRGVGLDDRDADGRLEDPSGRPARFSILTQQGHTLRERGAAVIQDQLRRVGLTVDVVGLEPGALVARILAGDYDAAFYGLETSDFEPTLMLQYWLSSGFFHLWRPNQPRPATAWEARLDELARRLVTTTGASERRRIFADMQRVFGEHVPALFFAAPKVFVAMSRRVANATPAVLNPQVLWNAEVLAVGPAGPP